MDHVRALQTPQFWLMWAAVFGNAIAGVSIISCAKTMMGDVFGAAFPAIVTGTFEHLLLHHKIDHKPA